MLVCPFPTDPKFCFFLFLFFVFVSVFVVVVFFFKFNFTFLDKIVIIKVSKYIVTVPKVYCVSTEGICLPHTCVHQIV